MSQIMPPIPRIFFSYIEPALILYGALQPLLKPTSITAPLVPPSELWPLLPVEPGPQPTVPVAPQPTSTETLWALQNATLLFGFALINCVVVFGSAERRVVRGYVLATALTDLPHWAGLAHVLRMEGTLWSLGRWSGEMKMLMFWPLVTFGIKVGYLMGWFGKDRVPGRKGGRRQLRS